MPSIAKWILGLVLFGCWAWGVMSYPAHAKEYHPWQVPVNNSEVIPYEIDCWVDIDNKGKMTYNCTHGYQYVPSWSPHGKRQRII